MQKKEGRAQNSMKNKENWTRRQPEVEQQQEEPKNEGRKPSHKDFSSSHYEKRLRYYFNV